MNMEVLKSNKSMLSLIILGLAIIPSTILGPKVGGIVLLLFVLNVAWIIVSLLGWDALSKTSDRAWDKAMVAKKEGDYTKYGVYFLAFPMIMIGIIMIFLLLFYMIFLL